MKKSNFLKSSKELLSRSFNHSKCKTALKLTGSRVKLLRNKKEAEVKQMKREIAQLLESGQDQTARIKVEHLVREEKMMAAYDLIEIYCELIAARMQIIETQKVCPSDLKEAIASVIFASPRCGDVPELKDVKKHFTEKYGKDFVNGAVELRPQSGVSRLLVEKLSATAPDVQTKIKILNAIAEEHNVKWYPTSFEEKDSTPPTDLLKGPRTFEGTKLHFEPPFMESPDVQAPVSNNRAHGSRSNLYHMDHPSSLETGNHTSAPTSGVNMTFYRKARSLGVERAEFSPSPGDNNSTHLDRHVWSMEFKDATAAAQAAAESAELASVAARAAAELSSRDKFMRQYTESHNLDIHDSEHGGPEAHVTSRLAEEYFFEERRERSFSVNDGLRSERIDGVQLDNPKTGGRFNEDSHGGMKGFSQSTSLKSRASIPDNVLDVYAYSRKNSLQEVSEGETNTQRQSFNYANAAPDKYDDVRERRISDDVNIFANYEDRKFQSDAGVDPFLSGKGGIYGKVSHESSAAVFDNSDSDNDAHDFAYDDHEPGFHFPSASQKSHEHLRVNPDPWSRRSSSGIGKPASSLFSPRKDSSHFSENVKSLDGSKVDDSLRMTFDESDEPALKHRNSEMEPNDNGKSSPEEGVGFNLSSLTGGLRHKGNNPPPFLKIRQDTPSSFGKKVEVATAAITRPTVPASTESPRTGTINEHKKSEVVRDFLPVADSDSSEEEESLRKRSGQKPRQYTPIGAKEDKIKPTLASKNSYFSYGNSDSDEDPPKESLTRASHRHNGVSQRTKATSFSSGKNSYSRIDDEVDRQPTTSSNSSKYETYEQQPISSKIASKPVKSYFWGPPEAYRYGKAASLTNNSDANIERNSANYHTPETREQYPSLTKNSSQLGNSDPRISAKPGSKPPNSSLWGTPDEHNFGKANSAREELSSTRPKAEAASVSNENPKVAATLDKTSSNKDGSNQRPSHVHPKLPDYDTLVQTLRRNRP